MYIGIGSPWSFAETEKKTRTAQADDRLWLFFLYLLFSSPEQDVQENLKIYRKHSFKGLRFSVSYEMTMRFN